METGDGVAEMTLRMETTRRGDLTTASIGDVATTRARTLTLECTMMSLERLERQDGTAGHPAVRETAASALEATAGTTTEGDREAGLRH